MTSSARLLVVVLALAPLLTTPGCQCVRTPHSIRARDELKKRIEKEIARQKEDDQTSSSFNANGDRTTVFDTEQRIAALREYFELKRWDAVRHEGLALENAEMDDLLRLEILMMLVEAFQGSGDRERADEYSAKFRKLYEKLRDSGRFAEMAKGRNSLLQIVGRAKAKAVTDLFVPPDGEQRQGVLLAKRLKEARDDGEVLEERLPDGGQVYFSRKPEALSTKLEAIDPGLAQAICRDPEFDYYYAVREMPRDASGRSGR